MSKRVITLLLLSLTMTFPVSSAGGGAQPSPCSLGTPYRGCLACGSAKGERAQLLNVLKNRDAIAENPKVLKVEDLREPNNNNKFSPDMAVEVIGYVADVETGGFQESCNCNRDDLRDIHINVVAEPREVGNVTKYVVIEITPRWEHKFGLDESDYRAMLDNVKNQIKGKWVKFRGWMLYDYVHLTESESTAPGNKSNWRATPWEVHPITSYQVLPRRPSE